MEVEILSGEKKFEEFLKEEQRSIYPDVSPAVFRSWIEMKEPPYRALYIGLFERRVLIGGSVTQIQDFLSPEKILLQLDALWIKEDWRRRGLGSLLLQETFQKARSYYQRYQMNPIGILIQTTSLDEGAETFYKKFFDRFHYEFDQVKLNIRGGVEIICFLVSF
ncbi:GNAT family N-acetyltransferase [bacterium]|nr:GNAT family N-acetyltransferase [bacterium]